MQRPKSGSPKKFQITGKLIVVEGIDGSGKSTQLHLLDRWLRGRGLQVFTTEWNSSQIVREITSKGQEERTTHSHHLQPPPRHRFCRSIREEHSPLASGRLSRPSR